MNKPTAVRTRTGHVVLPTYLPAPPDRNPMFLERRVYQGSSGRVYPLPCTDRIATAPTPRRWRAIWIENDLVRVMILPELGGRIHAIEDRTNGYDLIYRQDVIKPALVGLNGPWCSGGIEFNWPQHHRPATFLPVEHAIQRHADGSCTVWLGDHDPMLRMKGMHGVCLHPGRACVELKVRVHNRTALPQTFLWWANAATRVHEGYQSFFPPDVRHVADHARRATSTFPRCDGLYYGVDYGARAAGGMPAHERPPRFVPPHCRPATERDPRIPDYAPNDLSWYANIPTPCSYMAVGSRGDFVGGYDHLARAGVVHVADHRIAPGKKQWTWGNHPFGYAWDDNLTDDGAPYVELMAGVFTDNQPDFSFLQPGESRAWSQHWYPIQEIGPVQQANVDAAVALELGARRLRIGICVTRPFAGARVRLEDGRRARTWRADLTPGRPFVVDVAQPAPAWRVGSTTLRVLDGDGREILRHRPTAPAPVDPPAPATAPPAPVDVASADELFVIGLHLDQYRHATRCPTLYWREALRRDPLDARCNTALGGWHLRRGELRDAERHLRRAITRQTSRNPNPQDGEALYTLGVCLGLRARFEGLPALLDAAGDAFAKAAWNQAWAGAAHHALAELAAARGDWPAAQLHCERSRRLDTDHRGARALHALVLRRLGRDRAARAVLRDTLTLDPLDVGARLLLGRRVRGLVQARLDVAHDLARAGFVAEAIAILEDAAPEDRDLPDQDLGVVPILHYTLAWLCDQAGRDRNAARHRARARAADPSWCFPSRLEEIAVLGAALEADPSDARAAYYLGDLLYDRRRHREAIALWELSAALDPTCAVVWRNLGIGAFNVLARPREARAAYERALAAAPDDARLLYERDQLLARTGATPRLRLRRLQEHPGLLDRRDDLAVQLCALHDLTGHPERALAVLQSRRFQPWEGGEGLVLAQYVRAHLALGQRALVRHDAATARAHFERALACPPNLGEARHLLQNDAEAHYWLGEACAALDDAHAAGSHWERAARQRGDFEAMAVRPYSEQTLWSARALRRLGRGREADALLRGLLRHARETRAEGAHIDYFATSLPTMLLFEDDLQARHENAARFLEAQALAGLGRRSRALALLDEVLRRDPSHGSAVALRRELGGAPRR